MTMHKMVCIKPLKTLADALYSSSVNPPSLCPFGVCATVAGVSIR